VISQALANNGISYVQLKSGSKERRLAIQKFRTDKSIRAMGLNIVRANQGLNLIEANHVFIVEPNLLPAQEQQGTAIFITFGLMIYTNCYLKFHSYW